MIREHIAGTGRILLDDAYAGYPIGDYVNDIIKTTRPLQRQLRNIRLRHKLQLINLASNNTSK